VTGNSHKHDIPVSKHLETLQSSHTISDDKTQDAYTTLFSYYYDDLCTIAKHLLGDRVKRFQDVDDVANVSLFKALKKLTEGSEEEFEDREQFRRYLRKFVENEAMHANRNHKRQKRGEGKVRGNSGFLCTGKKRDEMLDQINEVPEDVEDVEVSVSTSEWLETVILRTNELLEMASKKKETSRLKQILMWILLGATQKKEFAESLGISVRQLSRDQKEVKFATGEAIRSMIRDELTVRKITLEDLLSVTHEFLQDVALREGLKLEWYDQITCGETVDIEAAIQRFPGSRTAIAEAYQDFIS
jgi:RNA polymerase sigma factor (sigma-70 family)